MLRENFKRTRHAAQAAEEKAAFLPVVADTYGMFGEGVKAMIKVIEEIAKGDPTAQGKRLAKELKQGLAIAIQAGNAFAIFQGTVLAREAAARGSWRGRPRLNAEAMQRVVRHSLRGGGRGRWRGRNSSVNVTIEQNTNDTNAQSQNNDEQQVDFGLNGGRRGELRVTKRRAQRQPRGGVSVTTEQLYIANAQRRQSEQQQAVGAHLSGAEMVKEVQQAEGKEMPRKKKRKPHNRKRK